MSFENEADESNQRIKKFNINIAMNANEESSYSEQEEDDREEQDAKTKNKNDPEALKTTTKKFESKLQKPAS